MTFEKTYTVYVDGVNVGETDDPEAAVRLGKALGVPFKAIGPLPDAPTRALPLSEENSSAVRFSLLELE